MLNGCESPRAKIEVIITAPNVPTAPVVSNVNYCLGSAATALTATGTNLLWYTAATGGTGSATAPTPSTAAVGTVSYYVSQTLNGVESPRVRLDVVVNPLLTAPAVSTVSYQQGAVATALAATGINLLWYTAATGGTGSATAPTPSTATVGTTSYYVSQTLNGCESPRAKIEVTVTAPDIPSAPVVSSVSYCQGAVATALTATGSNLLWYSSATGGTGSATAPTPSTATPGTVSYYVSQTVNGVESPRAKVDVVVNALAAAPTVSTVSYQQGAVATALAATGTNLLWYTAATGGTGSATAPTPSTAGVGATSYYVSQTLNGCESPRAKIEVIITAPNVPTAPVVSNVSYCLGSAATALTATGSNLLWYTAATGGTGSATAPTPSTAAVGTVSYYVSQTLNGVESPRVRLDVVVNPLLTAPAVSTVSYQQGAVATALAATGINLLWYTTATGGTGSATAPTPSTATVGTTSYYVSQTLNGCESPRARIEVTVTAAPTNGVAAPVVSSKNYCLGSAATALTATGTNLLWYTAATGGTGSATAPTPSTAAVGTVSYYVTQTVAGVESARAKLDVVVNPLPTAPAVSTVSYQQGAVATALTATGTNLLWYTAATGGTGSVTAPTPSTATVGTTSYYVSQMLNGCESPRAKIDINVTAAPTNGVAAPVVKNLNYCQDAPVSGLTALGANLLWYTAATGGTGSATAPIPSSATVGTTSYYVSQTMNGVESERAKIEVEIKALPMVTLAEFSITICSTVTNFPLTGGQPAGGVYSGVGVSKNIFDASVAGVGTHIIYYTYEENGCWVTAPTTQSIIVNTCTGIPESKLAANLSIYPNPTHDKLQLQLPLLTRTALEIRLLDTKGAVIYKQNHKQVSGNFNQIIDMSGNVQGVYLLQLILDDGVITKRIIKHY